MKKTLKTLYRQYVKYNGVINKPKIIDITSFIIYNNNNEFIFNQINIVEGIYLLLSNHHMHTSTYKHL